MKSMSYGTLPDEQEFKVAFEEEMNSEKYKITHGSTTTKDDARAGNYTATTLWWELKRLEKCGTEKSLSWCSDILGTLGFEWI